MGLLIIGAVVGGVVFLVTRATGRRREDNPEPTFWGTPMWLLGGLFMGQTLSQHEPGLDGDMGADVDAGFYHPGDLGGHDVGGGGFDGGFGGGGDFGGTP